MSEQIALNAAKYYGCEDCGLVFFGLDHFMSVDRHPCAGEGAE